MGAPVCQNKAEKSTWLPFLGNLSGKMSMIGPYFVEEASNDRFNAWIPAGTDRKQL